MRMLSLAVLLLFMGTNLEATPPFGESNSAVRSWSVDTLDTLDNFHPNGTGSPIRMRLKNDGPGGITLTLPGSEVAVEIDAGDTYDLDVPAAGEVVIELASGQSARGTLFDI